VTDDARIRSFLRYVSEMTSDHGHESPPDYAMRDHLLARFRRDVVNVSPTDETEVLVAIRRGTGT
jgi:hypothetical protein